MGLIEDRATADFRTYAYPRLEQQIRHLVGYDIGIDVKWDSLVEVGMAHVITHNLTNVFFIPLVQALQQVTVDAVGRDALLTRLGRIEIKNENGNTDSAMFATVEERVLILNHAPNSNVAEVNERVQAVIEVLENSL